ncbi:MAG: TIGR00341 family protein [Gemmatimonadales bacterium]
MRFLGSPIGSTRWKVITARVAELSDPASSFYVMTVLSTTIAAFGLLANSTAVVIGAMLVAPLMGPIFGIALAFTTGDRRLLAPALRGEVIGVGLAFGVAMIIGRVALHPDFSSEILSRTAPTLYDVIIALASGFAGAFALVDERISPALPGVAIATAIVPPLATAGLCVAAGEPHLASGALLLFVANFLAIEIAAAVVFSLVGRGHVHALADFSVGHFLRRFAVSLGMLVVITAIMTRTLLQVIASGQQMRTVREVLNADLASVAGAGLTDVHLARDRDTLRVTAFVYTPRPFEPAQVAALEASLRRRVRPTVSLLVRSLLSYDVNRSGLAFLPPPPERRPDTLQERRDSLVRIATDYVNARLDSVGGAQLVDLRFADSAGTPRVLAVVQAPVAIEPALVADWQTGLRNAIDSSLGLTVRSVLVREADSLQFLFEPPPPPPIPPRAAARRRGG